jgi:hypothetical protein
MTSLASTLPVPSLSTYDRMLSYMTDGDIDHGIHVSPEMGFLYVETPKCACTSTKYLLHEALELAADIYKKDFEIFGYSTNPRS